MSSECELEFDIGDNVEKIFNDMGLEKGSIIAVSYTHLTLPTKRIV